MVFVLNEYKNKYSDFFDNKNELINFKSEVDLKNKILFYLNKPKLRKAISINSYNKYHSTMNTKCIINYLFNVILREKINKKYLWT